MRGAAFLARRQDALPRALAGLLTENKHVDGHGHHQNARRGGASHHGQVAAILGRRGPGSRGKEGSAAHRSVVSFENPTYANPEEDMTYGGVMDDNGDDEGLYDQPAVTNSSKDNPMYASNEDLSPQQPLYANKTGADAHIWADEDDVEGGGGYLAVENADVDDFDDDQEEEGEEEDEFDGEEEYAQPDEDQVYDEVNTAEVDTVEEAQPAFEEAPAMLVAEEQMDQEVADFDDEEESDEDEEDAVDEPEGGYLDVQGDDSDDDEKPAQPLEGYVDVDPVTEDADQPLEGYMETDGGDDDYEEDDNLYGEHAVDFDDDE